MREAPYDVLFATAAKEMVEKRAVLHEAYGLDRAKGWDYDVKQAPPNFVIWDEARQPLMHAETLEVGTFFPDHSTWRWGWSNNSVPVQQQERLAVLRELADITGHELFRLDQPFVISRATAADLHAVAVQHLKAPGGYTAKIINTDRQSLEAHIAYTAVTGPR